MCGIMGYVGEENAVNMIITGLEDLEYRGYDSAGLAIYINEETRIIKCTGSPVKLREKVKDIYSNIGIGHTRWATHGCANEVNAHPHTTQNKMFTIVHNGIIENYSTLKKKLTEKGYTFISETDTLLLSNPKIL